MSDKSSEASGGIGLGGLLGVLFIALKLTGVIHWGWLWVLAPFWIPWAIVAGLLVIIGVIFLLGRMLG